MKLTVINLIIAIFLISTVQAFNFEITTPATANVAESFVVSIDYDTSYIYDVKIFVNDSGNNIISDTYNGDEWRSSYYYTKATYPQKKDYDVIIPAVPNKDLSGTYDLCVRLRKTNQTGYSDSCNKITVNQVAASHNTQENTLPNNQESQNTQNNNTQSNQQENSQTTQNTENSNQVNNQRNNQQEEQSEKNPNLNVKKGSIPKYQNLSTSSSPDNKDYTEEKIVLNPSNNSKTFDSFVSKEGKARIWTIYAILAVCIFIIIFLALRKL